MKKAIAVLILLIITWVLVAMDDGVAIVPDEVYEMCNQHIEWNTKRP